MEDVLPVMIRIQIHFREVGTVAFQPIPPWATLIPVRFPIPDHDLAPGSPTLSAAPCSYRFSLAQPTVPLQADVISTSGEHRVIQLRESRIVE